MSRRKLTLRQKEILSRVLKGWSNNKIAWDLKIRPRTVAVHLQRIYPKLKVHSRFEVIANFKESDYENI